MVFGPGMTAKPRRPRGRRMLIAASIVTRIGELTEVAEAIRVRRAHRMLIPQPIGNEHMRALAEAAMLSASCFNNQPWNFVFCSSKESLDGIKNALPKGNAWATRASAIIIVASKAEDDCRLSDRREYHLFDCGLAVGQLLLRATDLGFVAHPIAGYDPGKVRLAAGIPDEYIVVALIVCGYHGTDDSLLSNQQRESEKSRPARKALGDNFHRDRWGAPFG